MLSSLPLPKADEFPSMCFQSLCRKSPVIMRVVCSDTGKEPLVVSALVCHFGLDLGGFCSQDNLRLTIFYRLNTAQGLLGQSLFPQFRTSVCRDEPDDGAANG
jgi:hypothetical protein